jgi:hypothetical protein
VKVRAQPLNDSLLAIALDRAMAEEYGAPLEQWPVDEAVAGALAWSRAAGLTPDKALIEVAFTQSRVFAEDLYQILLVESGIPGAQVPDRGDDFGDK